MKRPNLRIEEPSAVPLRHVENPGIRYKGPHGRPTRVKKPKRVLRKARFNPKAKCSKCGYEDIWAQYCDKKWPASCRSSDDYSDRSDNPHIHRYCRRCAYQWYVTPLDAKQEIGPRRKRG